MEAVLNAAMSGNSLHHTEHKHYPSGFETSKYRGPSSISVFVSRKNKEEIVERQYFDPFRSKASASPAKDKSRPSSPYKITSDVDEYGDVAGQYFRDILTQRIPSRKGQRGKLSQGKKKVGVVYCSIIISLVINVFTAAGQSRVNISTDIAPPAA
jgi:hypothetical protein